MYNKNLDEIDNIGKLHEFRIGSAEVRWLRRGEGSKKKQIGIKKKAKSRKHEKTRGNYHEMKAKPMDQKNKIRKGKKERKKKKKEKERKKEIKKERKK